MKRYACIVFVVFVAMMCFAELYAVTPDETMNAAYEQYGMVLERCVDQNGLVNYPLLKEQRAALDTFITTAQSLDRKTYRAWHKKQKVAFWINLHNALYLKTVIDHYPIQPHAPASLIYPKNSIRQLPQYVRDPSICVLGNVVTAQKIRETIIPYFHEARVYIALCVADNESPALFNQFYDGDVLYRTLDDRWRYFFADARHFQIDRLNALVYISPLTKRYAHHLVLPSTANLQDATLEYLATTDRAIMAWATHYVSAVDATYLKKGNYSVVYLQYDWTLNEQAIKLSTEEL